MSSPHWAAVYDSSVATKRRSANRASRDSWVGLAATIGAAVVTVAGGITTALVVTNSNDDSGIAKYDQSEDSVGAATSTSGPRRVGSTQIDDVIISSTDESNQFKIVISSTDKSAISLVSLSEVRDPGSACLDAASYAVTLSNEAALLASSEEGTDLIIGQVTESDETIATEAYISGYCASQATASFRTQLEVDENSAIGLTLVVPNQFTIVEAVDDWGRYTAGDPVMLFSDFSRPVSGSYLVVTTRTSRGHCERAVLDLSQLPFIPQRPDELRDFWPVIAQEMDDRSGCPL